MTCMKNSATNSFKAHGFKFRASVKIYSSYIHYAYPCFPRWVQQASDAIALIFVADISAFDAVIDREQGLTRLHEALLMFRSVWNTDSPSGTVGTVAGGVPGGGPGGRHGISRSVILFLNKARHLCTFITGGRRITVSDVDYLAPAFFRKVFLEHKYAGKV